MKRSPKNNKSAASRANLPDSLPERRVSWFKSATSKIPSRTVTLAEVFKVIESGKLPIQDKIRVLQEQWIKAKELHGEKSDEAKAIYKKKQALKERSWLAAVSLSALFDGDRANENVAEHSGLLQIDLDHLETVAEWNRVSKELQSSPHIWKIWRSISGDGIKAAFLVPPDVSKHRDAFAAAAAHVYELTGKRIDEACKDPARLCFFSSSRVWTNPKKVFPIEVVSKAPVSGNGSTFNRTDVTNTLAEARKVAEAVGLKNLGEWKQDGGKKNVFVADVQCPNKPHEQKNHSRLFLNPDGSLVLQCFGSECQKTIKAYNALLREKQRGQLKETAAWLDVLGASVVGGEELRSLELPKRPPLLGDWFAEGDCGFVYAPRGVGKTWCALGMGAALSCGGKFGEWKALAPVKVLYVDGEMPADDMQRRTVGLAGDNKNLLFLQHEILFSRSNDLRKSCMNLTHADFRQALTDYCVREGVKVLFLDNLSSLALGMRENEADDWETVLPWLLDLRRRKIAVVIIHHAGRSGKMRGTTKREDALAWIIALEDRRTIAADKRGARFVSYFDKPSRNTQEETPAYEWHLVTESDGRVTVGCERAEYDGGAPKNMGRRKEIADEGVLGLLEPQPLTSGEWQRSAETKLKMPGTTFWHRLKEYRESMRIEKTDGDKWRRTDEKPF